MKTNKNFTKGIITKKKIKRMRNKIEKSKNKEDNHALYPVGERKEGKKETITDDNPTTICYHASHHEEEDTMTFPKTWCKVMFDYRVVLHALPKIAQTPHTSWHRMSTVGRFFELKK